MITRRSLVRGSVATIASAIVARPLAGLQTAGDGGGFPHPRDARLKELISAAIDAAITAGASYADARLTFTQQFSSVGMGDRYDSMGFGVRALVNGYWGFSASPLWNTTEAARLGRAAAANARANVLGHPREMTLAPNPSPSSGDWVMPVKDDPFEMALDEIFDFQEALAAYIKTKPMVTSGIVSAVFFRQQKAFGSSSGQFVTQRLYRTGGGVGMVMKAPTPEGDMSTNSSNFMKGFLHQVTYAGLGFEYLRDQPLRQYVDQLHAELLEEASLPRKPMEVGKYPALIDSLGTAYLVSQSIGLATEIDRAMGFESNANGTSYIIEPNEMLGSFKIGTPLLSITASRSQPGTLGCVRWDDDGVEPKDFSLVHNGILVDMQTHREGCGWIEPYYKRTGRLVTSHGCAYAPDAIDAPLVHSADLALTPGGDATSDLESLRSEIDRGIEWKSPGISLDFQLITGLARGRAFDIRKGKRISRLLYAGMLFRTTELWENVQRIGGPQSVHRFGFQMVKGEPQRVAYHSASAPPILVKDMTFIDVSRKA